MLITNAFKTVLSIRSTSTETTLEKNKKDAQRRILVFVLEGQNRLFATMNVAFPTIDLLLINFTTSKSWRDFF